MYFFKSFLLICWTLVILGLFLIFAGGVEPSRASWTALSLLAIIAVLGSAIYVAERKTQG